MYRTLGQPSLRFQPGRGVARSSYLGQGPELITEPPSSFDWGSIWQPVKEVLVTGAQTFPYIYGAIKGTGYPTPYPQIPGSTYGGAYPYGTTAQPYQAGLGGLPGWVLPVAAGIGIVLLMSGGGGQSRRRR
jgi:hypothetical protein